MCLKIDTTRHNSVRGVYFPHTAPQNLMIRKAVRKNKDGYTSPYRNTPIQFRTLLTTVMSLTTVLSKGGYSTIDRGFHGFTTLVNSTRDIAGTRFTLHERNIEMIYGIIPTGAKFYIGHNNEVVSDQIIYFKTKKDLLKYCKSDTMARPYSPNH